MNHVILAFVSVAPLMVVVAFMKVRRLRLALLEIVKRLIERWRSHGKN